MCMQVVQAHPMCTCEKKIIFSRTHATIAKTTRVDRPISGKSKKQELTPHDFVIFQDAHSMEREGA
jgi:hypothetical protein